MIASKAGEVLTCTDFAGGHALGVIMAFRPSNQPLHRSAPSSLTGPPRPPRRQPFSPTEFSRRSTALKTHHRLTKRLTPWRAWRASRVGNGYALGRHGARRTNGMWPSAAGSGRLTTGVCHERQRQATGHRGFADGRTGPLDPEALSGHHRALRESDADPAAGCHRGTGGGVLARADQPGKVPGNGSAH